MIEPDRKVQIPDRRASDAQNRRADAPTKTLRRAAGSAPGRAQSALQLDEQLTQPGTEFVARTLVETGEHRAFVGELFGQEPVDQGPALVGEPDMGDPPVAVVPPALDQGAVLEGAQPLGDGGPGGEGLAGQLAGVSSRSVLRTAPRRSNSARVSPAERKGASSACWSRAAQRLIRPMISIGPVSSPGLTACHCRTTEATMSSVTPLRSKGRGPQEV